MASYSDHPGRRAAGAYALGTCASGDRAEVVSQVAERLLELTAECSWIAGRAAEALGNLARGRTADFAAAGIDADLAVQRLIEMIDTYEEPDDDVFPDDRLCGALAAFGPAAAAALPRLRKLEKQRAEVDPGEMTQAVTDAIAAIEM